MNKRHLNTNNLIKMWKLQKNAPHWLILDTNKHKKAITLISIDHNKGAKMYEVI